MLHVAHTGATKLKKSSGGAPNIYLTSYLLIPDSVIFYYLVHEVCNILYNPGNLGNVVFLISPESWKYYPIPKPNPKPNPYPFLDPGRVISGNVGGPGPGRRAGSQNPNPLGGCAPQTPARGSSGRSGVQRQICVSSYVFIPHPASYVFQRRIFLV